VFHSTPTVYRHLAAQLADGHDLSRIRIVVLGGEETVPADVETFRRRFAPDALFVNGMGPTECTVALQHFVDQRMALPRGPVPVGYPVDGVEARLLNAAGEPVETYATGEITLRSAHVALGYWRRPEQTAAAFLPDPEGGEKRIYRTGDYGRMLPDGSIAFAGRRDGQVKIRGVRIETGEVESVLRLHPHVAECAVVAREDGGEKRLVAYVVGDADAAALRAHVRAHLPESMTPSAFVSIERLPLTPNGKLDRRALPAPVMEADEDAYVAPGTPTEEVLAAIWAEVLGRERVGAHDGFFDLGGHSLLATRVVSRVREAFGVELPLRALFEAPTVAGLAERVDAMLRGGDRSTVPPIVPVPRDGPLPLSFAQQRLWFLDRLDPGSSAYHMPYALRVRGALDVDALERTLAEIVRRHETLRTRFPSVDGEPVQVIDPAGPVRIARLDLSALPEDEDREDAARRVAADEAARPFDLAAGPLLRCTLVRLADDDHALLFTLHHVVSDGWSMGVLVREVSALYDAFARGARSPLPELPVQYADYALWQRRWLAGAELERQAAWWRERLAGAPALLEVPTDRPRTADAVPLPGIARLAVDPGAAARLRELARREGATPFMVALAAWQALLARWSGQDDVVVGTPVAGRTRGETEGLIGFFVNTLALRTDLSGDPDLPELLRRVREGVLGAFAHQDLPFERLVDELGVERSLAWTPVFQAMLTLRPAAPAGTDAVLRLGSARLEEAASADGAPKFDLSLDLHDDGVAIAGVLRYRADRFEAATADRLAAHFARLLQAWPADPDLPLSRVELMDAEERAAALAAARGPARPYPFIPVHRQVAAQAARTPDAVAVVAGGTRLTYAAVEGSAARLARELRARGAGPGTCIPFVLERGAEVPVAMLAVLKTGAAFVPLDPRWPAGRIRAALAELAAPAVLAAPGAEDAEWARGHAVLAAVADPAAAPPEDEDADAGAEDAIYVIYTSGSTGRPKGVVVPHRGIANRFAWMTEWFGADAARSVLQTTRHVYDSAVWQLLWPLTLGGRTVVPDEGAEGDAAAIAALVAAEAVTLTDFVPSVLGAYLPRLEADDALRAGMGSLRAVILGGEQIAAPATYRFMELFPDVLVANLYGPTEASIGCIAYRVTGAEGGRIPIGRPIANACALVLDRHRRLLPAGVPGELYLAGACVGTGYLGDGEKTRAAFVPNPFPELGGGRMYRTGDRARWLPDGNLEFLGRVDDQVKIRGFRIEPGEIEAALRGHPSVRDAVVVVREDAPGGRRLVGYVAAAPGAVSPAALRVHLRERLPEHMVPAAFAVLDALPLTPGGKVDRRALPAPEHGDGEAYLAPRTPVEEVLAGIWAEVLRAPRVGVHDDFFALGGHSLLATRVVSRVREAFGVEVPLRALFEAPTVDRLAERVEALLREGGAGQAPPLVPVAREGALPLSFAQERLWFLDQLQPGSAAYNLPYALRLTGALDVDALERTLAE
ncbi:MAG TPA: amino acid adenylation domain-containing protein, partial [Longimicrobium sp.]|nr:amino acid adenylation domain-containing protein [Longimicrobium sp.]